VADAVAPLSAEIGRRLGHAAQAQHAGRRRASGIRRVG
jgi:hypothetical protein